MVEKDPVANLFRGRNLSQSQRAELTKQFGLDKSTGGQFVDYLKQTATLNFGRSYQNNAPVAEEIRRKALPTIALAGTAAILSAVFGILLGIAAAWRRRTATDYTVTGVDDGLLLDARLLAGHAAADHARRGARVVPGRGHHRPGLERHRAGQAGGPGPAHVPADAARSRSPT